MRVSVDQTDAGYINYRRGYQGCTVLLNGVKVDRVFTADEERGEVICADLDPNNQPFCVGDAVARRTLHGKVQIIPPK